MPKTGSVSFIFCFLLTTLPCTAKTLPPITFAPHEKVASVNQVPITWGDISSELAASHEMKGGKAGRIDYPAVLRRLINTRLILLEARNIGLDQLPELKDSVETYSRKLSMEMLLERHVRPIGVNDSEVAPVYEAMAREWKIQSLRIQKEADAKKIEEQAKAGEDFRRIVEKARQWGIGEADEQGVFVKTNELAVPVAQIIAGMKPGDISPVLSIGKKGFVIFKLEESRIPEVENAELKQAAIRQALNEKKVKAAKQYYEQLRGDYVKVDDQLLDALDYESSTPGLEALLADQRVIAECKDDPPVTVAELSRALKERFYHGVELAIQNKAINRDKTQVFEDILQKRILRREALRQGVDRSADFAERVSQYENSAIFGAFIQKVVIPDIRLEREELETYYQKHADRYASPRMVRIKSLVFDKRDNAVKAIDKLRNGTDFDWLGANADGQTDRNARGLLHFDGRLLTMDSLPDKVREEVQGAKAGDLKLYESAAGHYYVLTIAQVVEPRQKPFAAVQMEISKEIFDGKVKESIEQWARKLETYYPVKIYKPIFKR